MTKAAARTRVTEQSRAKDKKHTAKWLTLYDQIAPQEDIILDAGKGSRRANAAEKKITSIRKKLKKLDEKKSHGTSRILKDYDLVNRYGESAMEARSFGTDRGVDYDLENYYPEGLHVKDPPIKSTHKLDRKKGKAEGGMIGRKKKTGDARKAPKVHPMIAAARKRKPHPTGGHPITPERPKLKYKKGKGVYSNSVRSPNW
jgi:hypothetical protein